MEYSCARVGRLVTAILLLAEEFNFSVTSWLRSTKRNKAVGGVENSLHLKAEAVDIVLDDVTDSPEFLDRCAELNLMVLDEGNHLHVALYRV